jgi:hypothetical protein
VNVGQLMEKLRALPQEAAVLPEGDEGYSPLGGIDVQHNDNGLPDEVVLQRDLTPD